MPIQVRRTPISGKKRRRKKKENSNSFVAYHSISAPFCAPGVKTLAFLPHFLLISFARKSRRTGEEGLSLDCASGRPTWGPGRERANQPASGHASLTPTSVGEKRQKPPFFFGPNVFPSGHLLLSRLRRNARSLLSPLLLFLFFIHLSHATRGSQPTSQPEREEGEERGE